MYCFEKSTAEGVRLTEGGEQRDQGRGRYVPSTRSIDVTGDMAIARKEVFGPELTFTRFDNVEDAMVVANHTKYGLAASVLTKIIDKALTITRCLQAGRFWVNTRLAGGPELQIVGFKQSVWRREAGTYGVEEYTQFKSVHIEIGKRSPWIE